MLLRTDPFHELDRLTQQVLGTAARPVVMPMDAFRQDGAYVVELDLPGVDPESIDLNVNATRFRSGPNAGRTRARTRTS
jgi:HSP20 family protein